MPMPIIRNRSKVVACTAYTPIAVMMAMTGTRVQFGMERIRVKMRTIGMFRINSMTLAMNSEAIRPQTMSGCCWNNSGPGVMLYRVRAPIITAVVPEPGTPRVSIGTRAPQQEAPMAVSGAARPRLSPWPNLLLAPASFFSVM
ncbi:hypothetical protein D3C77_415760 [compost metagenome]